MNVHLHGIPRFSRPIGLTHAGYSTVRRRHASFTGLLGPLGGVLSHRTREIASRTARSASLSSLTLAASVGQPSNGTEWAVRTRRRPERVALDGAERSDPRSRATPSSIPWSDQGVRTPPGGSDAPPAASPTSSAPDETAEPTGGIDLDPDFLSGLREAEAAGGDRSIRQFVDRLSALREQGDDASLSPSRVVASDADSVSASEDAFGEDRSTADQRDRTARTPDRGSGVPRTERNLSATTTDGPSLDDWGEAARSDRDRNPVVDLRVTATAPEHPVEGESGPRRTLDPTHHQPSSPSTAAVARTRAPRVRTASEAGDGSPTGIANGPARATAPLSVPTIPRSTGETTGVNDPPLSLYRPMSSDAADVTPAGHTNGASTTAAPAGATNGEGSAPESPAVEATAPTSSPPPVEADAASTPLAGADLDRVADRVYHAFERRMRVERERRGF